MEFNCEDWDIGKEASGLASSLFKKEQKKNKRKRKNEETNNASTESNVEQEDPPVVSKKVKKATPEMPSAADRVSLIQQQLGGEEKLSKKERKNLRRKRSKLMRKLMNPAGTVDVSASKKPAVKDKTKQTGPNSNFNSAENDVAVKKKSKGKNKEKRSINGETQSGDNSNSKAVEGTGGKNENNKKRKRDKKTVKTTEIDSSSLIEQSDSASQVTDSKSDDMNSQSSSPTNKKKRKRVSKKNKFKGYVKPERKENTTSTSESLSSDSSNKQTVPDSDDGNNAAKSDDAQSLPKTPESKKKKRKKKKSTSTETDYLDVNATITNGKQSDVSKSVDKKSDAQSVGKSNKRNSLDPKILSSILNPCADKTETSPALSPDDTDIVTMETGAQTKGQSFLDKSKERLNAARFRYLNEQLYTTTGKEAFQLFKYDKTAFDVYHEGFQSQVEKWPSNPIDIIIKQIQSKPKHLILADFGCGDAKLARSVQQKVHSFDLVALNDHVTVCDMSKVPVKDSTVDIAVFCLSLMGTNLTSYLKEANRVLKNNGTLIIAEVVSRFQSVGNFIMKVEKIGFKVKHQNSDNKMFVMMEFKKTMDCKNKDIEEIKLKPCVYKKR